MKREHMIIVAVAALVLLWLWSRSGSRSGAATLVPLGADPGTEQARLAAQSQAFDGLTQAFASLGLEQIRSRTEIALGDRQVTIANVQAQSEASRIAAALEGMKLQTTAALMADQDRNRTERSRSIWDSIGDVGVAIIAGLFGGQTGGLGSYSGGGRIAGTRFGGPGVNAGGGMLSGPPGYSGY